ncbi:hypothetical protein F5Y18DRAFT_12638 [Xylariaceae sp. FL1019]|nr:hypothetical protein F5Y18DRAFT_12638 [Xylariaceae sp. FL1019]
MLARVTGLALRFSDPIPHFHAISLLRQCICSTELPGTAHALEYRQWNNLPSSAPARQQCLLACRAFHNVPTRIHRRLSIPQTIHSYIRFVTSWAKNKHSQLTACCSALAISSSSIQTLSALPSLPSSPSSNPHRRRICLAGVTPHSEAITGIRPRLPHLISSLDPAGNRVAKLQITWGQVREYREVVTLRACLYKRTRRAHIYPSVLFFSPPWQHNMRSRGHLMPLRYQPTACRNTADIN